MVKPSSQIRFAIRPMEYWLGRVRYSGSIEWTELKPNIVPTTYINASNIESALALSRLRYGPNVIVTM